MFDRLFEPIRIGKVEIKNRLVLSPMVVHYAGSRGEMTERMLRYYEERARGGVGLVLTETVTINPEGRAIIRNPGMFTDEFIPGWSSFIDAIHWHGARTGVQLGHGGSQGPDMVKDLVAPSAIPRKGRRTPRELTLDEIEELIEAWGNAARRAKDAGFDFVEAHGSHGYLIGLFCSPLTNKRTDKYGADRDLFAVEILRRIKAKCGEDYPVIYRLNSDELVDGGITIEDAKRTAKRLEDAGMDAFDVTGSIYDTMDYLIPPMYYDSDDFYLWIKNAKEIKKVVSVPVISGGLITKPEVAVRAIEEGYVDMIYLGRMLIADPEWPNKAKAGRVSEIRRCIAEVDGCQGRVAEGKAVTCAVNPIVGWEYRFSSEPEPAPTKKRVIVVGGGPGGMEAALVAGQRGHEVTLIDRGKELGGTLKIAGAPSFKKNLNYFADWIKVVLPKYGVKVELEKEATADSLLKLKPDVVVLATGSKPLIPDIPGANNAVTADDALLGKIQIGKKVVIVGGGFVGCETALHLARQGKEVTVVEALDNILQDTNAVNRLALGARLLPQAGVKTMVSMPVVEIGKNEVIARNKFGRPTSLPADTIILAVGRKSDNELQQQLRGKVAELYTIGDCVSPRKIVDAVQEGFGVSFFL